MSGLQRLVFDYRTGELVIRVLYSTQGGPNPGTKARTRDVSRDRANNSAPYRRSETWQNAFAY